MELFVLLQYTVSMVFLMIFMIHFLPLRYSVKKTTLISLGIVMAVFGIDYVRIFVDWDLEIMMELLATMLEIIIVQGAAFLLSRYRDGRALFVGLSSSNYVLAGNVSASIVMELTGNVILAFVVQIVIHSLVLMLLVRGIRKEFLVALENKGIQWEVMCCIPVVFYTVFFVMVYVESNINWVYNIAELYLSLLALAVTYGIIFLNMRTARKVEETRRQNAAIEAYAKGVMMHQEAVQSAEERIRILRHDQKHFVSALQTLVERQAYGEIQDMLNWREAAIEENRVIAFCENSMINGICCSMDTRARRQGVKLDCKITIPEQIYIDQFELVMILTNLLDNAITAAAEQDQYEKIVHVRMRYEKTQLLIEVSNPYGGTVEFDHESGLPVSHRRGEHGFGTRSIASLAKKYRAVYDCTCEGHEFIARLMFCFS